MLAILEGASEIQVVVTLSQEHTLGPMSITFPLIRIGENDMTQQAFTILTQHSLIRSTSAKFIRRHSCTTLNMKSVEYPPCVTPVRIQDECVVFLHLAWNA